MADIFVSYRREDGGGHAGRLVDDLREHFQNATIFQDVESIHAGADFVQAIGQAIAVTRVMLVIIGPDWLDPAEGRRHSRIHDNNDPVRCEIAWAFYHRRFVIPVLVGGAKMVMPEHLPPDIRFLPQIHAHEQSVTRWSYDIAQLAGKITTITGLRGRESGPPVSMVPRRSQRGWLGAMLWMLGGALMLLFCSVMVNNNQTHEASSSPANPNPTELAALPAHAPTPAPVAPLDVSGAWYEADRASSLEFEQVGAAVSVRAHLQSQQAMVVGQGQWASGQLSLNLKTFSLTTGAPGADAVMTLTPSADQRQLRGTLQASGQSAVNVSLSR
jgi:hypothetical protein